MGFFAETVLPDDPLTVTNFIASTQSPSVVDFTASNSPSRYYRALIQ